MITVPIREILRRKLWRLIERCVVTLLTDLYVRLPNFPLPFLPVALFSVAHLS